MVAKHCMKLLKSLQQQFGQIVWIKGNQLHRFQLKMFYLYFYFFVYFIFFTSCLTLSPGWGRMTDTLSYPLLRKTQRASSLPCTTMTHMTVNWLRSAWCFFLFFLFWLPHGKLTVGDKNTQNVLSSCLLIGSYSWCWECAFDNRRRYWKHLDGRIPLLGMNGSFSVVARPRWRWLGFLLGYHNSSILGFFQLCAFLGGALIAPTDLKLRSVKHTEDESGDVKVTLTGPRKSSPVPLPRTSHEIFNLTARDFKQRRA